MTLEDLKQGAGGEILSAFETKFTGVGTDTRKDLKGQIFFALRGDQFDAHKFLSQAVEQGASALVVDQKPDPVLLKKVSVIQVKDTLQALQSYSHFWRKKMKAKVLSITGSNGKTSTKQFAHSLLKEHCQVLANEGSFNNHWGVPLTLLNIRPEHQVAVVEMGMNHPGEITQLCKIAEPDVVCVTMVGRAHMEFFGSIEKIAEAKEEIYLKCPEQAIRIFNLDNPQTFAMWERYRSLGRTLTFSAHRKADIQIKLLSASVDGLYLKGNIYGVAGEVNVPVFGEQNLGNLQAAAALALAAGLPPALIWKGLAKCGASWGRNQWLKLPQGAKVLFDAYNANPDSMKALIENVRALQSSGRKFAVLGDMLELGKQASQLHEELGENAARAGFEMIYFVGHEAAAFEAGLKRGGFSKKLVKSDTCEQALATSMGSMLHPDDIVFMKASRGVRLEQVLGSWNPENFQTKK